MRGFYRKYFQGRYFEEDNLKEDILEGVFRKKLKQNILKELNILTGKTTLVTEPRTNEFFVKIQFNVYIF